MDGHVQLLAESLDHREHHAVAQVAGVRDGGVARLAVTKAHGARVTAVDCKSKLGMLRSLGADKVADYTREDVARRGVRYDLIFDVPGKRPLSACRRALKPDGR